MLKHVVCQKFQNPADAEQAAHMLRALEGQIPTLRSMEVGINIKESERAYDLVLIACFDDMAGLAAYDKHPAHEAVRAFIKARRTGTVSVDYECE